MNETRGFGRTIPALILQEALNTVNNLHVFRRDELALCAKISETPFTDFFMSISFSALYTKSRKGRRLTDLGTEGPALARCAYGSPRDMPCQTGQSEDQQTVSPIRTGSLATA